MSKPCEVAIEQAKRAAAYLDTIGERKRANDVRAICTSNSAMRNSLRVLHRENMELRAALAAKELAHV